MHSHHHTTCLDRSMGNFIHPSVLCHLSSLTCGLNRVADFPLSGHVQLFQLSPEALPGPAERRSPIWHVLGLTEDCLPNRGANNASSRRLPGGIWTTHPNHFIGFILSVSHRFLFPINIAILPLFLECKIGEIPTSGYTMLNSNDSVHHDVKYEL